jgi:V8-like Glu-specific endopeptidase
MKKLTFILSLISFYSFASDKVIYGEDNRKDVHEVTNPEFVHYARSIAARIWRNELKGWTFNRIWELKIENQTLKDSIGICSDERFSSQPALAGCTGFLVSPNHLLTAGHCISNQTCGNGSYYWLFDYHMPSSGDFDPRRSKHDYVSCKKIVKRILDPGTHLDYALIELKKPVTDREPLKFRREGQISIGDKLVVIGHPSGLPTKIADEAEVRDVNNIFFTANLDTFGGNSGSPVINTATGEVEGILVRGAQDYIFDEENQCKRPLRLPDNTHYESATVITNIKELAEL